MAEYESPLSITIPIPSERPPMGGIHSVAAPGAGRFNIRFNPHELDILYKAATILNLPTTTLVRDAAVNTAEKIVEHYNAYQRRDRS